MFARWIRGSGTALSLEGDCESSSRTVAAQADRRDVVVRLFVRQVNECVDGCGARVSLLQFRRCGLGTQAGKREGFRLRGQDGPRH